MTPLFASCTEPPTQDLIEWLRNFGPYSSLFYGGLVALLLSLVTYLRSKHSMSVSLLAVGGSCIGLGLILGAVAPESRWRVVLGFVPAFMVGAQVFTMFRRSKWVIPSNLSKIRDHFEHSKLKILVPFVDVVETSGKHLFDSPLLVARLLLPAVFIYSLCSIEADYLVCATLHTDRSLVPFPKSAIIAADYGLAGAYLFITLHLGNRSYRSDITSGAAIWSMVTLATGPVVAGVLGMFVGDLTTAELATTTGFGKAAIFFVAGFSPRFVVSYVEGAVRRSWMKQNVATTASDRTTSIDQLRGMTPEIAERLAEEGITTATAMAMGDPVRLIWNTGFDKRLLLRWMDQAILLETWPSAVEILDKYGMFSAIVLAKLFIDRDEARMSELATALHLDIVTFRQVALQLSNDHQVKLIWTLYELEDFGDSGGNNAAAISPAKTSSSGPKEPAVGAE